MHVILKPNITRVACVNFKDSAINYALVEPLCDGTQRSAKAETGNPPSGKNTIQLLVGEINSNSSWYQERNSFWND